jgi:[NiFe] hydrogenase assembly HybE family chaperone
MNTLPAHDALAARVDALRLCFERIAATRMQGVPILNPALQVEAIGFEPCADEDGAQAALGVLLTPWFMNLIRLPMQGQSCAPVGTSSEHRIGKERFEFIGAHEASFGDYEMCSLFSPMFGFADQEAARATAWEVLRTLRAVEPAPVTPPRPGRRAFLRGWVTPGAGA